VGQSSQSLVEAASRPFLAVLSSVAASIGRSGVHPNVLTAISLVPALAAGVAAAWGAFAAAALLLLVSGVFDLLDGAVARQTGKTSRFGALLDSSLDRLSDAAVPAGMVLYYAPHGGVIILPLLLIVSGFSVSYVRARAEGLQIELPRLWMRREDRMVLLLVGLLLAPLPFPGFAMIGGWTLAVVAILAVLSFIAAGIALGVAARNA
jgi:CDP-diacylglycerol--glycerol-3-phosphate 3-phosphatidyltransferase